jgi:transposase
LLAEIGDARRFQRPRQLVRASGLNPSVIESAESERRGRLAKHGSRHLRWALLEAANHSHRHSSPDHDLYASTVKRCGRGRARLTVARKIARRSYHVLLAAEAA